MIIACIIVTADQREGNEGKYRVGFSATPEYDPDDILINPGSATVEEVRTALTGLNDGSLVVGERGLERAQTSKNAPASDGGVKIEQTPAETINEAQRVENAGEGANNDNVSSVRHAIDPNFSREYDRWDKKSTGGYFRLGTISTALQSVGIDPGKIFWDKSKVKEILNKHPEIDDATIKQIPNLLENPILIMQSQTAVNRVVLLGEVYGTNGAPVLAALELRPDGRISNFVKVASAYGKGSDRSGKTWSQESVQKLIDDSDILYVDPNKNRTDNWLQALRLQLPAGVTKYGPLHSVSHFDKNVNGEIVFDDAKNSETAMERAFREAQERKNASDNDSGRRALPKKPKSQTTEKKARLTKEEKADEYKKVMDTIDENEGGYHTRLDYQKISEALDRRAKEKAKAQAKSKTKRPPEDEITRENFEKAVAAERERLEREAAVTNERIELDAKSLLQNRRLFARFKEYE